MHPSTPPSLLWRPLPTGIHAVLALSFLRCLTLAEVNCGGHLAHSCGQCTQGQGEEWCHGDCEWRDGDCIRSGTTTPFPDPDAARNIQSNGDWPMPPDTRPPGCKAVPSPAAFSNHTVSVVLPWLGETWEHLEGTLRSLVHFTPDDLIEEYLFVSDGNDYTYEKELKAISPKVKVLALPEREGLIRAKMKGVDIAKGPVIVFMEGHCIVNRDWLQPLLQRVALHPKILAMPSLDVIPTDNWYEYYPGVHGHWRYEWNFNLILTNPGLPPNSPKPFPSPGTSGGIFAMRKDWFQHLGLFDDGMLQWGGDHFELTMKVWRCGGRIEIVPCSRIGHVFRTSETRPYNVEINQVVRNYARLSRIWTQSHLDFFYKVKPEAREFKFDDMEELHEKHRKLKCRSMGWYLANVDFEMAWEMTRICIPGAPKWHEAACKGEQAHGRSTIDQVMSYDEYWAARSAAKAKAVAKKIQKQEREQREEF